MRHEAEELLNAITVYNKAHLGDSDDAEIDAAFEMEEAALVVLRKIAVGNVDVAELLDKFDTDRVEADNA